jgi:hypothetical protein
MSKKVFPERIELFIGYKMAYLVSLDSIKKAAQNR